MTTTHQPWHLVMPQSVTDGPFGHMGWCIDCQRLACSPEPPPSDSAGNTDA